MFAAEGFGGARLDEIARRAPANIRMVYHYFGDKERLYRAVLEQEYGALRAEEERLALDALAPADAIDTLFTFTFDYFDTHRELVSIILCENQQEARFLSGSALVPSLSSQLITSLARAIARGVTEGCFRAGLDPLQLYVSMVALSFVHISNRATLSRIFDADLSDAGWLRERKAHGLAMIRSYVAARSAGESA